LTLIQPDHSRYVETPLMKQYNELKAKHPDAVLLFRVGDFYETFGEDAILTSKILGITLTRRANGSASFIELAGFPYHALDTYLPKLVRAGQRVAICEQLEDPKLTKKIVKRGITELITPGVAFSDNILERKENNYLCCVHLEKALAGISFLDMSTGEFFVTQGSLDYIEKIITTFQPKEVLFEKSKSGQFTQLFGDRFYTFKLDDWMFNLDNCEARLLKHFQVSSLKGFGIQGLDYGIIASGAILQYLEYMQHHQIAHIASIARIEEENFVWLDRFTVRNLELYHSMNEGGKTLLDIIDHTSSPMGGRLLKRWIALPLKSPRLIEERLNAVTCFIDNRGLMEELDEKIERMGDLERLASKIAIGKINPRELQQLRVSLELVQQLKYSCTHSNTDYLKMIGEQMNNCQIIKDKLINELSDDLPVAVQKGNVIKQGVNAELDELRGLLNSGKDYILQIQQREIERTGISSLKVSFNNVFGYYIEVRNTHKDKVPSDWIRKQTLVSAERYITEELKVYEEKILGAEGHILEIETRLFQELVASISEYIPALQLNASKIAQLDCLLSFSKTAIENNYCKPEINNSETIEIKDGRHPVIEKQLQIGKEYIANDILLNSKDQQIIMITGPNMSGKSALLRQTALIVIMAQMGCYVPASEAKIGWVDKIFTRVGASDNISAGESTFMVEMIESASILNNLSSRSLVLLDEIGRGTSTYDGISIAWAMVEFIHEHPQAKAKTLFATHYHELNEMEKRFQRIKNYNVSVKELDNKVIFTRKLLPGGTGHSFGIHVAQMAGMPKSLVNRANEILKEMEQGQSNVSVSRPSEDLLEKREGYQLSIFQLDDPVLKQIREEIKLLDINTLTPIEALNKLNQIKKIAGI